MRQAIAGYDPNDFSTEPMPVPDYSARLNEGVRGLRVRVPRRHFFDRLDGEVRAAEEGALEVLRGLGAEVRDVECPDFGAIMGPAFGVVIAEQLDLYGEIFRTRPQDFGADVAAIYGQGAPDG